MKKKEVFDLLAVNIVERPLKLKELLKKYGYPIHKNSNRKQISDFTISAIEKMGNQFHKELAKLLYSNLKKEDEDSFDLGAILGGSGGGDAPGITVGADPVSAIAGAVGSIANLFGNKQKKRMAQDEARNQMFQSVLSYKARKEQQKAKKQAAIHSRADKEKLLRLAGTTIAIGLIVWLAFNQSKGA